MSANSHPPSSGKYRLAYCPALLLYGSSLRTGSDINLNVDISLDARKWFRKWKSRSYLESRDGAALSAATSIADISSSPDKEGKD
jgi:hypothetical protein